MQAPRVEQLSRSLLHSVITHFTESNPTPILHRTQPSVHGPDALLVAALVEITTRDGRVLRHHTTAVRGTAANPMTRPYVDTKCFDLMTPVLGKTRARKLIDTVWNIDKVTDMRGLRPLLQASRPLP